tara:strand:+ start:69 stop:272 length:204 start_codon:yes stop_codon:yes gene_type:complete
MSGACFNIVFSRFSPKPRPNILDAAAISKETNYVIVKDPNETTAKANKARELNILISVEELKQKYNL